MNQTAQLAAFEPFRTPESFPSFKRSDDATHGRIIRTKIAGIVTKTRDFSMIADAFRSGKASLQDVMRAYGEAMGKLGDAEAFIGQSGVLPLQAIALVREQRHALVEAAIDATKSISDNVDKMKDQTSSMNAFIKTVEPKIAEFSAFYSDVQRDIDTLNGEAWKNISKPDCPGSAPRML